MGPDFDYIDADSEYMVEWTSAIDLARQIGLFICSYRILIVVGGTLSFGKKKADLQNPFTYISATRRAITKRTPPFEFPRQISLNAPSNGTLIVGAAPASVY